MTHIAYSEISNNLMIKSPLISNFPKCSTILCYPYCNYKVGKYIFHICIDCTGL